MSTKNEAIAALEQRGIPTWASGGVDRALGGPAERHRARARATVDALTPVAHMTSWLLPPTTNLEWFEEYAIMALLLALDVGRFGGNNNLGDWKVANTTTAEPSPARSARSFPFTNLGSSRWNAADGDAYRAAAITALAALSRMLNERTTALHPEPVAACARDGSRPPMFEVRVDRASGRPTSITWSSVTAPWPDLRWPGFTPREVPDMAIQGLTALHMHKLSPTTEGGYSITASNIWALMRQLNRVLNHGGRPGFAPMVEETLGMTEDDSVTEVADEVAQLLAMLPLIERLEQVAQQAFTMNFAQAVKDNTSLPSATFVTVDGITIAFYLVEA